MRKEIAMTVELGEDSICFYREEVRQVSVTPLQHCRVQPLPNALPSVQYEGEIWRVLTMQIHLAYADTLARIHTIRDWQGIVNIQYATEEGSQHGLTGMVFPDYEEKRAMQGVTDYQLSILEC